MGKWVQQPRPTPNHSLSLSRSTEAVSCEAVIFGVCRPGDFHTCRIGSVTNLDDSILTGGQLTPPPLLAS